MVVYSTVSKGHEKLNWKWLWYCTATRGELKWASIIVVVVQFCGSNFFSKIISPSKLQLNKEFARAIFYWKCNDLSSFRRQPRFLSVWRFATSCAITSSKIMLIFCNFCFLWGFIISSLPTFFSDIAFRSPFWGKSFYDFRT